MKKGQITLFVVLGIIFIAVLGVTLYLSGSIPKSLQEQKLAESEALSQDEKNIVSAVEDCLEFIVLRAALVVAKNGGYYPAKKDSIGYMDYNVPIYYNKGKEVIPPPKVLEHSFENYINDNALTCLPMGVDSLGEPKSDVSLGSSILVKLEMPIKYKDIKLKKFFTESEINYLSMFNELNKFYSLIMSYNVTRNFADMARELEEGNYKYSHETYDDINLYFLIQDDMIENTPIIFSFGILQDVNYSSLPSFDFENLFKLADAEEPGLSDTEAKMLEEEVPENQYDAKESQQMDKFLLNLDDFNTNIY